MDIVFVSVLILAVLILVLIKFMIDHRRARRVSMSSTP
jgi:hypothetical protein